MAGIGIHLNQVFSRRTVTTYLYGIAYSTIYTIGPLIVVIGCILLMYKALGFQTISYMEREVFSSSILYIFIFSLLITAPFNSVLSKYMTDRIYLERFDDIRPAIYTGIVLNLTFASLIAIPFYIRVYLVGKLAAYYVFTCYMGFLSLTLVLAAMIYNSIMKHYKKVSQYFILGMIITFLTSLVFRWILHLSVSFSMLLSLTIGFMIIAILEFTNALKYFRGNSLNYWGPLIYFKEYWQLALANFLYTLGLFGHNFVFWTVPWNLTVINSYVCNQSYDMASSIALFTSITASVLFIVNLEMHFFNRYAEYTNAVIGGKLDSIEITKKRMFRALTSQLTNMIQVQFIVSIVIFLIASIILPIYGFGGITMQIYPLLGVGYFIAHAMYSAMLFLQYFNDLKGLMIATLIFSILSVTLSLIATKLSYVWAGSGFAIAAFVAFTFIYFRLKWLKKNLDYHIFCRGKVVQIGEGKKPNEEVYRSNKLKELV